MSPEDRFWICIWGILALAMVPICAMIAYQKYQSDRLHLQSPILETCVKHRADQKVTVEP